MSTRCQIEVRGGQNVKIYKHSDGYQEGVLPVLVPIMRQFYNERGDDPTYATAQIIRAFARNDFIRRKNNFQRFNNSDNTTDKSLTKTYSTPSMLGWGVDTNIHGDIEWFYWVDLKEAQIEVYSYPDPDCEDILDIRKSADLVKVIDISSYHQQKGFSEIVSGEYKCKEV